MTHRDILEQAARKLELLAQFIRDENFDGFESLTYNIAGAYCTLNEVCVNVDLNEVETILSRTRNE